MSNLKERAFEVLNRLHQTIDYNDYSVIFDALSEIETLEERDGDLEELWVCFSDIPMNPETECMEEDYFGFPAGTHREEIWHWFDERHSKGVHYLLYELN